MAKGNWKPEAIRPKARCRYCGFVVKGGEFVRVDGVTPAHRKCADRREVPYTIGPEMHKLTRATQSDIDRMWKRLWGDVSHGYVKMQWDAAQERGNELMDMCEGLQIGENGPTRSLYTNQKGE